MVLWCPALNLAPGVALTSLVARPRVSPFGKLLIDTPPALAAPCTQPFFEEAAMTPRIEKKLRQARSREQMHVTHRHAAGIDIHPSVHWVEGLVESLIE